MTRVYVDMVGDLFHYGHVEMLRRAKELGDELVVGVLSDDLVATYKRRPILTMDERVRVVAACRFVDEVIPDAPLLVDRNWIERHRIDLVVHGDDVDDATLKSWFGDAQDLGIFRVLPYTPGISTSDIIGRVLERGE